MANSIADGMYMTSNGSHSAHVKHYCMVNWPMRCARVYAAQLYKESLIALSEGSSVDKRLILCDFSSSHWKRCG